MGDLEGEVEQEDVEDVSYDLEDEVSVLDDDEAKAEARMVEVDRFNSYIDAIYRRMNAALRAKMMDPMQLNLDERKKAPKRMKRDVEDDDEEDGLAEEDVEEGEMADTDVLESRMGKAGRKNKQKQKNSEAEESSKGKKKKQRQKAKKQAERERRREEKKNKKAAKTTRESRSGPKKKNKGKKNKQNK